MPSVSAGGSFWQQRIAQHYTSEVTFKVIKYAKKLELKEGQEARHVTSPLTSQYTYLCMNICSACSYFQPGVTLKVMHNSVSCSNTMQSKSTYYFHPALIWWHTGSWVKAWQNPSCHSLSVATTTPQTSFWNVTHKNRCDRLISGKYYLKFRWKELKPIHSLWI